MSEDRPHPRPFSRPRGKGSESNTLPQAGEGGRQSVSIAALHSYPVKSCRGLSHAASVLRSTGLEWDRHFLLITDSGRFITQRECAGLARIDVAFENSSIVFRAAGHGELRCPLVASGPAIRVRIWNDECTAQLSHIDTRDWLEAAAGIRGQLVHAMPGQMNRDRKSVV